MKFLKNLGLIIITVISALGEGFGDENGWED